MKEIYYFVFGKEVSDLYLEALDFQEVVDFASKKENSDISVCAFNTKKDSPSDLLAAYDGWNGYAEITKHEYLQLKTLIAEN